jgi:hypothetical protein
MATIGGCVAESSLKIVRGKIVRDASRTSMLIAATAACVAIFCRAQAQ